MQRTLIAAAAMAAMVGASPARAAFSYNDLYVSAVNSTTGAVTFYDYGNGVGGYSGTPYTTGLTLPVATDHDGLLRMSSDNTRIVFGGTGSGGATVVSATLGQNAVSTVGTVSGFSVNVRSVVSTDGTEFWVGGAAATTGGVYYYKPSTASASQIINTDTRALLIAGTGSGTPSQQLYEVTSAGIGGAGGVLRIGAGLPRSATTSLTQEINGSATDKDIPKSDALFLDENGDGNLETAYTTGGKSEIEKYHYDSSTGWTRQGYYDNSTASGIPQINQLYVSYNGSAVTILAATANGVYSFTDTNASNQPLSFVNTATPTLLFSAPAGQNFRGLVVATPEPTSLALVGLIAAGALRRRRS